MNGILEQMASDIRDILAALAKCPAPVASEPMVDQQHSALGRRRHCAAVRRRRAEGADGAEIVGKKHLLSRAALAEELARCSLASTRANDIEPSPDGNDAYHRAMSIARSTKVAKR
jgi:hypothetical protein